MLILILVVTCVILISVYLYLIWPFDYWKKRGVKGPKPLPFVGNYLSVFTQKRNMACDIQDIYETYKRSENFVGIFNGCTPQLLILDVDLIKRVLVSDFKNFHDNDVSKFVDKKSDVIFGNNPFLLTGENWKERRAEITPGFTTNRIKTVFPVTNKVCKSMLDFIEQQTKMGSKDGIDAKDLCLRFTCEVVTDCVLGLSAGTFTNQPTPIMDMSKKMFEPSAMLMIYLVFVGVFPSLYKYKKLRFVPKVVEEFFIELMNNSLSMRKNQKQEGINEDRVDFMNYILHLQEKKHLTIPELTGHTMTFLVDGFETTASVLSHCLLMLGREPRCQEILRKEVCETLNDINDFDAITELPYLDACIHETLRIIPAGGFSTKMCTESIDLQNKDGNIINIPEGMPIIIPSYAVMKDEHNYENPDNFEPERFLDGGLKQLKDQGIFLGFGDGPRICLGMRFALTQIKGALVNILRNYRVRINPRTRSDWKIDPTYLLMQLDGGIWLEFDKIN
ncbi:putative cytochrome P450 28a5 [Haematobia irritans]|uniref:putative cytochrome P450 28a5 n=1 Tax=Haematobia irritans TaxID=7368 RepID=UPI003F50CCAA